MFTDQFMKESRHHSPSHRTYYRHRLHVGSSKKQETAVLPTKIINVPTRHSVPTVMNILPHCLSVDSKQKKSDLVVASSQALNFSTCFHRRNPSLVHQPLQMHRNAQTFLTVNNSNKTDCRVHFKSPVSSSPMKKGTTASQRGYSCLANAVGGLDRTINTAKSTDSVLSVSRTANGCKRSVSTDLGVYNIMHNDGMKLLDPSTNSCDFRSMDTLQKLAQQKMVSWL